MDSGFPLINYHLKTAFCSYLRYRCVILFFYDLKHISVINIQQEMCMRKRPYNTNERENPDYLNIPYEQPVSWATVVQGVG